MTSTGTTILMFPCSAVLSAQIAHLRAYRKKNYVLNSSAWKGTMYEISLRIPTVGNKNFRARNNCLDVHPSLFQNGVLKKFFLFLFVWTWQSASPHHWHFRLVHITATEWALRVRTSAVELPFHHLEFVVTSINPCHDGPLFSIFANSFVFILVFTQGFPDHFR